MPQRTVLILTLDWRSFAGANSPELFGLQGTRFIKEVGQVAKEKLESKNITSAQINVVAHSWGTFVGYVMANAYEDNVNSFVSLDTAKNNIPAKLIGSSFDSNDIDFRTVAVHEICYKPD